MSSFAKFLRAPGFFVCLGASAAAFAQDAPPPISSVAVETMKALNAHPKVKAALAAIERDDAITFRDQLELTEIPAPPFKESVRAADYLKRMRALGLDARIDTEGNVIGVLKGRGNVANGNGPRLVLAAHLDTVFPEGTDVKVKKQGDRYYAPGIGDDTRGLAALLQVIRSLKEAKIETEGDIVFVGNVGEEELGDLRGVKALFRDDKAIDGFISIDGITVWRVVTSATGSRRYKISFKGPGGHSYGAFGLPSAIHAMGRAIAKMSDVQTPKEPKTTFTVGTVGGGTSVNAIAADAELGLDMRSESTDALNKLEKQMLALAQQAADEENARWNMKPGNNAITASIKLVGDRPAGTQPATSPVIDSARAAITSRGIEVRALATSSTDSNLPISLGIPAATVGGGGNGGGAHAPGEWYSPTAGYLGPQTILLTVLGLVGVAGPEGATKPLLPKRTSK
jgi:acetylornithine deacetylase/succinyl-diaminopimelate desuccinylase-like protein